MDPQCPYSQYSVPPNVPVTNPDQNVQDSGSTRNLNTAPPSSNVTVVPSVLAFTSVPPPTLSKSMQNAANFQFVPTPCVLSSNVPPSNFLLPRGPSSMTVVSAPPIPATSSALPTTLPPLPTTSPPLPTTSPPLPAASPPLPAASPPLPVTSPPPLPTTSPPPLPSDSPPPLPHESPPALPTEAPPALPSEAPPALPSEAPPALPSETPPVIPTEPPSVIPMEPLPVIPTELPPALPTEPPPALPTEPLPALPTEPLPAFPTEPPPVIPTEPPPALPTEPLPVIPTEPLPALLTEPLPALPIEPPPVILTEPLPALSTEPLPVIPTEPPLTSPTESPATIPTKLSPAVPTEPPPSIPTESTPSVIMEAYNELPSSCIKSPLSVSTGSLSCDPSLVPLTESSIETKSTLNAIDSHSPVHTPIQTTLHKNEQTIVSSSVPTEPSLVPTESHPPIPTESHPPMPTESHPPMPTESLSLESPSSCTKSSLSASTVSLPCGTSFSFLTLSSAVNSQSTSQTSIHSDPHGNGQTITQNVAHMHMSTPVQTAFHIQTAPLSLLASSQNPLLLPVQTNPPAVVQSVVPSIKPFKIKKNSTSVSTLIQTLPTISVSMQTVIDLSKVNLPVSFAVPAPLSSAGVSQHCLKFPAQDSGNSRPSDTPRFYGFAQENVNTLNQKSMKKSSSRNKKNSLCKDSSSEDEEKYESSHKHKHRRSSFKEKHHSSHNKERHHSSHKKGKHLSHKELNPSSFKEKSESSHRKERHHSSHKKRRHSPERERNYSVHKEISHLSHEEKSYSVHKEKSRSSHKERCHSSHKEEKYFSPSKEEKHKHSHKKSYNEKDCDLKNCDSELRHASKSSHVRYISQSHKTIEKHHSHSSRSSSRRKRTLSGSSSRSDRKKTLSGSSSRSDRKKTLSGSSSRSDRKRTLSGSSSRSRKRKNIDEKDSPSKRTKQQVRERPLKREISRSRSEVRSRNELPSRDQKKQEESRSIVNKKRISRPKRRRSSTPKNLPCLSLKAYKYIISTPSTKYYISKAEDSKEVTAKDRLKDLHEFFRYELVDRAARIRALKPKYEPPKRKTKLRKPKPPKTESNSDSSSSSEKTSSDEEDTAMEELERKKKHPDRLHLELWFNDPKEMNDGPLCRCSAKARRAGIRHGIYVGEDHLPLCDPYSNNSDKLYHYRITMTPHTNFLTKNPTTIRRNGHEYRFEGFSMFSHLPLPQLPNCKVIRFNYEYTILYVEEEFPKNFTVQGLELFSHYLLTEILELVDINWKAHDDPDGCPRFHFMPRFTRELEDGGKEILAHAYVLEYLLKENQSLIKEDKLSEILKYDDCEWQYLADEVKGMIVTCPGMKPSSIRVDQLDREQCVPHKEEFPVIVHFGVRPPQLSYAGNPHYQKAWRDYVKYRHLLANKPKVRYADRHRLNQKETRLQEMRMENDLKRDVTVVISSKNFYKTGIMSDIIQHAMLLPVLVCHLRFHQSLVHLEKKLGYNFKDRFLLQLALTHPSYRENFGTNPDHARNSLTNCGLRQPQYGDRRIHYMNTRKRGINTLINIMSRFGSRKETLSRINHNERLEFLGDAVVEFLSSVHLFYMFPDLEEGGLATYRAAIVQNQHLAVLSKKLELDRFMLYAHGSDLCHDLELRHAMANCFEALMGALFLDNGIEVADKVFSLTLFSEPDLLEVWKNFSLHPLQEQEPDGDRKWIASVPLLQKLNKFEEAIGIEFNHIRLLARALTHRSLGYNNLTLGSNQRLEFLGDTVLQLVASEYLYKYFPEHHEGHLSLLRSSLVNNRTQAVVCADLGMVDYAIYPYSKVELKPKDKADLLEAFLGALYVDKDLGYCRKFCEVCFFPRLQDFIMNQDWNDPKSKLQQCCLTLRSMDGGEPDIPTYKVIECKGPTNTRVYSVAVYFQGNRLAVGSGHSIQQAEMDAASNALKKSKDLFPQLRHQRRAIERSLKHGPSTKRKAASKK